jgi:hypothetical protein
VDLREQHGPIASYSASRRHALEIQTQGPPGKSYASGKNQESQRAAAKSCGSAQALLEEDSPEATQDIV